MLFAYPIVQIHFAKVKCVKQTPLL